MQITEIRVDDQITHVAMAGKLDIAGLHAVDMKFHGYTAARRRPTLVDLSGVELITSLGMGMFISCARSLQRFGARMVLLNPQPQVEEAMKAVGIDQGIPIVHSVEDALRILLPRPERPMTPTYQRTLARTLSDYLPVAEEVEAFCEEFNTLPTATHSRVRLVIEELVLNLIDHATGSLTGRIDLRIDLEASRVVIVLEDDADPFDPRSAPAFDSAKPLEQRGPRGMGIHLVRSMAEGLEYERVGSRNRLRVTITR